MAKKSTSYENFKAELLKDPETRKEYEALEPQFKLIRDILRRRNELNISQEELANRLGTKQSAISRLERGYGNATIDTLLKIANALDSELDISLKAKPRTKTKARQPVH